VVDDSLRVLHVSQPTDAGVAVCVTQDVSDQIARGWRVHLACPAEAWLSRCAHTLGAEVHSWPASRSPGAGTPLEVERLCKLLRAVRPHVLHLHSSKAMLAGRLAAQGRVMTVVQPHAWSFEAVRPPMSTWVETWERVAARWTSAFVCVSRAEQRRGQAVGIVGRYIIAPNGVDLGRLCPATQSDRLVTRRRYGIASDTPLAVCVGRLSKQKGQDLLVASWPHVRTSVPNARLVLVGDGPMRPDLAGRISPDVHLFGASTEVQSWLAAADVVVCPSRYEGMALVPLEAMACARSVVASDIPPNAETLPVGGGALVASGDPVALARAISTRLCDVTLADAEGRIGRAHVEAHHDVRMSTAVIADLYRAVLLEGPATR
jgi:glycosyltransferase involved in cell wall biosynthesis